MDVLGAHVQILNEFDSILEVLNEMLDELMVVVRLYNNLDPAENKAHQEHQVDAVHEQSHGVLSLVPLVQVFLVDVVINRGPGDVRKHQQEKADPKTQYASSKLDPCLSRPVSAVDFTNILQLWRLSLHIF